MLLTSFLNPHHLAALIWLAGGADVMKGKIRRKYDAMLKSSRTT